VSASAESPEPSELAPTVAPMGSKVPASAPLPPDVIAALADPERSVGRYVLLAELGRGGMGVVHRAYDTVLRRPVALKMINEAGPSAEQRRRFQTEASAVARLDHPGIVAVHDTGEHRGRPFFVMELVDGESFEALLARGPVPLERTLAIVRDVATALAHAHSKGVLHRDVKPENIVIDRTGRPRLMDFGLARELASAERLTASGSWLGTPAYMAPEQADGAREQGPAADVYALGAVLYRAVAGRPPFNDTTLAAALKSVLFDPPVPPSKVGAAISPELERLILRCLAKRPSGRPNSAEALAAELERLLRGPAARVLTPTPPVVSGTAGTTRGSRGPRVAAVALLAVAALAALALRRAPAPTSAPPSPPPAPPTVSFDELDPPAGKPVLLEEPVLRVSGRLSDPRAGPVSALAEGRSPVTLAVDAKGVFKGTLELDAGTRAVELRAAGASQTITTEVDLLPPRITFGEVPGEWRGGPLSVACDIEDDHPKLARLWLRADGKQAAPPLERTLNRGPRITATFAVPPGSRELAVVVEAEDLLGRRSTAERRVAVDPTPPSVVLDDPADGVFTRERALAVRGRVAATARPVVSTCAVVSQEGEEKGRRPAESPEGRFDLRVYLPDQDGPIAVAVLATDQIGNVGSARVTVVLDRVPPTITIEGPADLAPEATVCGMTITSSEPLVSLVARGREVIVNAPDPGPWTVEALVDPDGAARLTVTARDRAGNSTQKKGLVLRREK
jgi:serine/threonine protein kinase